MHFIFSLWQIERRIDNYFSNIVGNYIGHYNPALGLSGDDHENDALEITRFGDEAFPGEL